MRVRIEFDTDDDALIENLHTSAVETEGVTLLTGGGRDTVYLSNVQVL